jgi:adenine-specific DNA-methyltransferase
MDEVFGDDNHCGTIQCQKTTGAGSPSVRTVVLASVGDQVLWYSKIMSALNIGSCSRKRFLGNQGQSDKRLTKEEVREFSATPSQHKIFAADNLTSQSPSSTTQFVFEVDGKVFRPGQGYWKTRERGLVRLRASNRLKPIGNSLMYRRFVDDFPAHH